MRRTVDTGTRKVNHMAEVKSICSLCLEKKKICPVGYPDIKSVKTLHEDMPKGYYAHCEDCHKVFLRMREQPFDGIVIHWCDK